jgi:hypothetical protein
LRFFDLLDARRFLLFRFSVVAGEGARKISAGGRIIDAGLEVLLLGDDVCAFLIEKEREVFGVVLVSGAIGYADALIASEEVAAVAGTVVAGSIAANSRGDLGGLPSPKHHQAVPAAKGSATTI